MTCDSINAQDFHERYALGQLTQEERAAYEAHVISCKQCTDMSRAEILFVSEIRAAGKAAMKSEILEQAETAKSSTRSTRWTTYAKVASIGFFLMLVPSLYYIYENRLELNSPSASDTGQTAVLVKDEAVRQDSREVAASEPVKEMPSAESPVEEDKSSDMDLASESRPSAAAKAENSPETQAKRTVNLAPISESVEFEQDLQQILAKPTDRLYFRRAFGGELYVFQIGSTGATMSSRKKQESFDVQVDKLEGGQLSIVFDLEPELYKIAEDSLKIVEIENENMHISIGGKTFSIRLDTSISKARLLQ